MNRQFKIKIDGKDYKINIEGDAFFINDVPFVLGTSGGMVTLDGIAYDVKIMDNKTALVDGREYKIETSGFRAKSGSSRKEATVKLMGEAKAGSVIAVMPGAITNVLVKVGDKVKPDTVLLIIEAMKMLNEIAAERTGTVKKIHVEIGDKVEPGQLLVEIE